MPSLAEKREELQSLRDRMHQIYEQAGPELDLSKVTVVDGDTHDKVAEMRRLETEMTALGQEVDQLTAVEKIAQMNELQRRQDREPVGRLEFGKGSPQSGHSRAQKGLRDLLAEHKGFQQFREGRIPSVEIALNGVDIKTLVTLTTINTQAERRDPVAMALEDRTVTDLMFESGTDANTIEYYEETGFTNNAVEVAEGAAKPESDVVYTLRTESVRKIAHFIPATRESLQDVAFLEGQIRGRLAFGVRRREETQVLSGNGIAPNLRGILNRTGIQTQAKGTDPAPDAIYKAMQLVRGSAQLGFAEPTAAVINPTNWTAIKLLRTADGIYLWGNPSDEGPDRIWGLTVRQTTGIAAGTALVGAFRPHAQVLRREGITITMSTEHASYFTENKVAILAETRLAVMVDRPSAFAQVTGL